MGMRIGRTLLDPPWLACHLLLLIGMLLTLHAAWRYPANTFYNGDLGVKFIQVQQVASGYFANDIRLPEEPWLEAMWKAGMAPIQPPFAYLVNDRFMCQYIVTFAVVSAPFYMLLGFKGLLVIPLLSVWAAWLGFYVLCRRREWSAMATTLGLATFVLGSHMAVYATLFWEHGPGVLTGFLGGALLLVPAKREPSTRLATLAGAMFGLTLWLRPEAICYFAAFGLVSLVTTRQRGWWRSWWAFSIAAGIVALAFFAYNQLVFEHPLGLTRKNMIRERTGQYTLVGKSIDQGIYLHRSLVQHMPVLIALLAMLPLLAWRKMRQFSGAVPILAFCLLASFFASIVTPEAGKEWGPRYLLISVPYLCLALVMCLHGLRLALPRPVWTGYLVLAVIASLFGHRLLSDGRLQWVPTTSTIAGLHSVVEEARRRVTPIRREVALSDHQFVVAPRSYVCQEFASLMPTKTLLVCQTPEHWQLLAAALDRQGLDRCIMLDFDYMATADGYTKGDHQLAVPGGWTVHLEHRKDQAWMRWFDVRVHRDTPGRADEAP